MTDLRAGSDVESEVEAPANPVADGGFRSARPRAAKTTRPSQASKPTRVVAARVPIWHRLAELWRSRELFVFLVRKEIKVKYKDSFLGFLWSMLNPALNLAVFFVLFTYFLPNGVPQFVIYMFSAMLVWNLFSTTTLSATGSIVHNSGLVKKVAFPREILPLASVGSACVFFMFQSVVMVGFMLVFWHRPDWSLVWLLIPALAAILVFAAAVAVFLSAVNVYMRDTMHLVEVLLMAWFWASPGIYAFSGTVHDKLANHHLLWLYFLNPVTPPVMSFQRVFYNEWHPRTTIPPHGFFPSGVLARYGIHWYVGADLAVLGASLVLLLGALMLFGRLEGNFAEEL